MKSEDKRSVIKRFKHVDKGDAFMYKGDLYMKTENLADDLERVCNSVRICSGKGEVFRDNMMVEMIDAKVVIE